MSTTENNALLRYIDDNGNIYVLYPVTNIENVLGFSDKIVNNFTTTAEGFVADARALKSLNDKLTNPTSNSNLTWGKCTVAITRYGKLRWVHVYINAGISGATKLGTIQSYDWPAYDISATEWIMKNSSDYFSSVTCTINTLGEVNVNAEAWRGGFTFVYTVP